VNPMAAPLVAATTSFSVVCSLTKRNALIATSATKLRFRESTCDAIVVLG
jgi:hypothetical protein